MQNVGGKDLQIRDQQGS